MDITGHIYYIENTKSKKGYVGKYETKEVLRERAQEFLKKVATLAMLPNCSGKP